MKILFFIRSLVVGGSQRQLIMLADGLARRGHDTAVAVFYTGDEIDIARQQTVTRVVTLEKAGRWDVVGPLSRLRRLLLDWRPDAIYAFQPTQTVLAALMLPHRTQTRLVFGVRAAGMETGRYDRLSAVTYRSEAWLSRRADLIIASAYAGRTDAIARGMPADRIVVVPNGIDTDAIQPDPAAGLARRRAWGVPDGAFLIGCVARLDPMKDHATFLRAAGELAATQSDVRFVCVGDGPTGYRDELRSLALSLGLAERLIWAGEVNDVGAAYNAFDIATLASAFGEGFPSVVGEAMACGIPVVGTDVGDVRRIVGEIGEVVPPKQPGLLSAGWRRMRKRIEQNPALGVAARNSIVERYSIETMVDQTETMLARLVSGESGEAVARNPS